MIDYKRGEGRRPSKHETAAQQGRSEKGLIVFALTEGHDKDDKPKTFWTRIGRAFKNSDGSLNIVLDALPVSGRCQVRVEEPRS